jgi:hypothetical protein
MEERNIKKRPTSVIVISIFWIIVGFLSLFWAFMGIGLLISSKKPEIIFVTLASTFALGIGLLKIVSGINFFKLRSWARTTLEVISWIYFILSIFEDCLYLFNILNLAFKGIDEKTRYILNFMNLGTSLVFSIIFGTIIYYLRSKKVKDAMAKEPREEENLITDS